jgi:hypothetical protein
MAKTKRDTSSKKKRQRVRTRKLKDVESGKTVTQLDAEDSKATIETEGEHPLRRLAGTATCSLDEAKVLVDDDLWSDVFGLQLKLAGGTELDVDGSRLDKALEGIEDYGDTPIDIYIPMIVRDVYLPPIKVLVRHGDLRQRYTPVEPGSGPRSSGEPQWCRHESPTLHANKCRSCFLRWWMIQAKLQGIEREGEQWRKIG